MLPILPVVLVGVAVAGAVGTGIYVAAKWLGGEGEYRYSCTS